MTQAVPNAERQRAYRARRKIERERAARLDALPLMTRLERAELRAALLEAADLLEHSAPKPRKSSGRLLEIMSETPQEEAKRRADSIRAMVEGLAL